MTRFVALVCALLALGASASVSAQSKPRPAAVRQADPAAVQALVQRARALGLSRDVMWHRLLHYRGSLFGGFSSQADWEPFFLATDGKSDPEAELEATLRGFFGPEPTDPELEHPFCRFPARLAWLNSHLQFDFSKLPRRTCPGFQQFLRDLRPRSLTLVFSSYYLNNPASAFGHTFLRVNKQSRTDQQRDLELLDYGIDYSARVDTANPLLFAAKGMTGQFAGVFRRVPVYLKVREYNDSESRDLWEYELALSKQELSMVMAHLWELGPNHFDYFYLDENCSYHVLAAIEAAGPRLRLLDRLAWPVLPVDTVKAVVAQPGLVRAIRYRPSNRTQYRARVASLNPAELDAALDLVDFRFSGELAREPGTKEDPESVRFKQRLLERRAALDVETGDDAPGPPFRDTPHIGHSSRRLALGSGFLQERGWFHSLGLRLALHDLADPTLGYPETSAIEFLPIRFRYYVESPKLELEDFSFASVTNITPLDRFEHTLSWTVNAGGRRLRDAGRDGCFAGTLELGAGLAAPLFTKNLLFYALADAQLFLPVKSGLLSFFRGGVGPSGGVRVTVTEDLHLLATGHWLYLPGQTPRQTWQLDAALRWQYSRDFAIGAEATRQPEAWAASGTSYLYF